MQRNSSRTSLIDSTFDETFSSKLCIPSFNSCAEASSDPSKLRPNSSFLNRNFSKCIAAVRFNFSPSYCCNCLIVLPISLRLCFSTNVVLTALIVSLNTEKVAVTFAHNVGYVVIFPEDRIVDRPLCRVSGWDQSSTTRRVKNKEKNSLIIHFVSSNPFFLSCK